MQKELILKSFEDLKNASLLLKYSIDKFKHYNPDYKYSPEELQYYDSLSFRFEKVTELVIHFFKGLEVFLYAEASDTLRSRLLNMQKLNLVDNIEFWMEARILRNKISHTYESKKLKELYEEIKDRSIKIFSSIDKIELYLESTIGNR